MRTELSSDNPFGYTRHGFAFEHIDSGMKCLDYGCYDGHFIKVVRKHKDVQFVGVDKNKRIIAEDPYKLGLIHIIKELPFDANSFDCVTLLDVIEHVFDQESVLREIHRVLKVDGELIVTVPRRHVFSFLDLKNLMFLFPSLGKLVLSQVYSRRDYEDWYVNSPDGLVGDVEKEKLWHEHFTTDGLESLLSRNGFTVSAFDGSGLFERVFIFFDLLRVGHLFPKRMRQSDRRRFEQANLFCRASRVP